jgi:hypothetical protein
MIATFRRVAAFAVEGGAMRARAPAHSAVRASSGSAARPLTPQKLSFNTCGMCAGGTLWRARADTSCFARRLDPLRPTRAGPLCGCSRERAQRAGALPRVLHAGGQRHGTFRARTHANGGARTRALLRVLRSELGVTHPLLPFLPLAPSRCVQARCYSASALLRAGDGASAGDGEGSKASAPAPAAPAGSRTARTFFVQLKGDAGLAKLVTSAIDVGDLVKHIKNELELTQRPSSLVLQLASSDGTLFASKDADGNERPVTLDSMATIDKAVKKAAKEAGRTIKRKDQLRIIVDVSAPSAATPAAVAVGECGCCVTTQLVSSKNGGR